MTQAGTIGLGGVLGAGCRYAFGLLSGRAVTFRLSDLSANAIGPSVVVIGVHLGLLPTLPPVQRTVIATGALAGYMLVSTLRAANSVLAEGERPIRSVAAIGTTALGCLVAGALGLGLARCLP